MSLIADIGGTNARFAIIEDGELVPRYERTLACANYHTLVDAVLAYLDDVSRPMPDSASLAIATPVLEDRVVMTNHTWDLSVQDTRVTLGLNSLKIINDYTALALALTMLAEEDLHKIGQGEAVEGQTKAVLGPGTGLGVSGCIFTGEYWLPIQGEGGHVSYASSDAREAEIIELIRRYHDFVSAESLVSGPGLVLLYQSITKCDGIEHKILSPEQISEKALNGEDPSAEEALAMFCGVLGSVAGNLALTLGARGGVYIGGGIVPGLGSYFDDSPFREKFEDKGRFRDYLSEIPTSVITSRYPALLGAAISTQARYLNLGVTSHA